MSTDRDVKLGRALASIPLPELPEDFYSELVARLEQARLEQSRPESARREPPLALAPRRQRRARMLRAGLVAAAVAAAVTVAVVLFGLPGLHETGPQTSLAAQVLAKMTSSLGSVRTFEADEISTDYQNDSAGVTSTSRIALTAAGDGRESVSHGKWILIYNDRLGIQWTLVRRHGRLVVDSVVTDLPAGNVFSNIGDSADYFMQRSYSTALRALLAAHQRGMDVRSSKYQGRPAWTVTFAYDQPKGVVIRLTIDQQTGLVFASGQYDDGQPKWESRVENVRINQPLAPGLFLPPAALRRRSWQTTPAQRDYGFDRMSLSRVQRVVGSVPLVPAYVPTGYELADVTAVAKSSVAVPPREPCVSMVYRRGFSSFTIGLMLEGGGAPTPDSWQGGAFTAGDLRQQITLTSGALSGSRAEIFIGLWAQIAEVWVWGGDVPLNVVISGDLTRDELVAVAESLQPYGGDH